MSDLPLTNNELGHLANLLLSLKTPILTADYTNWRGVKSKRTFKPYRVWYGATQWHPEPCLLLRAVDLEKGDQRDFKLADFDMETLAQVKPTE